MRPLWLGIRMGSGNGLQVAQILVCRLLRQRKALACQLGEPIMVRDRDLIAAGLHNALALKLLECPGHELRIFDSHLGGEKL